MARFTHIAAVAGSAALLAAGLFAAAPAQAAPDTHARLHVKNCLVDLDPPSGGAGNVSALVRTSGCNPGVKWNAVLQSSRWWGWADDANDSWNGSGERRLSAGCGGVHDHRVIVQAVADGQGSPWKVGPKATIDCG